MKVEVSWAQLAALSQDDLESAISRLWYHGFILSEERMIWELEGDEATVKPAYKDVLKMIRGGP